MASQGAPITLLGDILLEGSVENECARETGTNGERRAAQSHSQGGLYLVIGTMCVLTLTRVGISSRRPPTDLYEAAEPIVPLYTFR